ncbi:MAG: ABC transporter substrate-binding protein [SAR202 cluster bacterium]|jgi:ABC-type transport system substrate-binding protein|nr:ABC transporter substrate-binding protein [SAR202 cluster bacterium]
MKLCTTTSMRLLLSIAVISLLVVAVACGSSAQPKDSSGSASPKAAESGDAIGAGEKITVLVTDVQDKNWFTLSNGGPDLKYSRLVHEDIFATRGRGDLIPGVAKEWKMSEDATAWTVTIQDGIKFHDGSDLTVDDVIWTLSLERDGGENVNSDAIGNNQCADPKEAAYVKYTDSLEKTGDNEFTYTQNRPSPNFPFNFSQSNQDTKALVMSKAYMAPQMSSCFAEYEKNPIGAGPFKYVKHQAGVEYQVERYDDYYHHPGNGFADDRRAKFESLDLRIVLEAATRVAALQSGEADVVEGNIQIVDQLEKIDGANVVWQDESAHSWFVMVDCWEEDMWCYDKKARHAVQYAADFKTIGEELYGRGASLKGWAWATENALGYTPELDYYPYDPAKAAELWKAAGLGADNPVSIKIHTWEAGSFPMLPQVAELVAKDWEANLPGMSIEVNIGDQGAIKDVWNNREIPGDVLIRDNEARYDGTSITRGGFCNVGTAWRAVKDPAFEPWKTICGEASKALDDASSTREASFQTAYKYLRDESLMWGPFFSNVPWGIGPRVASYEPWTLVPYFTAPWTIELK